MGFLDRLLGREPDPAERQDPYDRSAPGAPAGTGPRSPDERAVERYRYLLATAPPEGIEQAHAEAFAQLTPDQRRQVLQQLAQHVPPSERLGDDPAGLARMATRTELRNPGTLERTFGGAPAGQGGQGYGGQGYGGPGLGTMIGGSLLGTVAGVVVGSAIANAMFGPAFGDLGSDAFAADAGGAEGGADGGDAGNDAGGGDAGGDAGGGDVGGDAGGFGGDFGGGFGGGDFGGDFGGGDFGGDF